MNEGNSLSELKKYSVVVADTADLNSVKVFSPQEATTNPSLILMASRNAAYKPMLQQAIRYGQL